MDFLNIFENKTILVTGGTGSIGSEIVSQLLKFNPKTIRILTNSENELWEAKLRFKDSENKLRFLLGDIRNYERIVKATENVDLIFNAAAIKHVPISEYNPMEAIDVNVHGLNNIIEAALYHDVEKLIHISTDKAVSPTTVMGATKMLGERLCISREASKGKHNTKISCVRFGNVLGTRGSIIPLVKEQIKNGNIVTLTDVKMRRFFLSINQAVELVLKTAFLAQGGEIFVLKMPTMLIKDLIEVIIEEFSSVINKDPSTIKIEIIGASAGEKLYEELISPTEYSVCYETHDMYCIYPLINFGQELEINRIIKKGTKIIIEENFSYGNKDSIPMEKEEIREFIKKYNLL